MRGNFTTFGLKPGGLILACVLALSLTAPDTSAQRASQPQYDPALYQALTWRNVGPFRGGRVTTVEGVPSKPFTFYMGATGGGVWQTDDGGEKWRNISDGWFKTGSVGAIAVSLSDPNVLYVGMGEHCVRGVTTSHGDGVYKSTDGGKSWTHVGLTDTRHISEVLIHPTNPDIVYVGAQGSPWGPHSDRGVYRTLDGGETWEKVLSDNDYTGVNDLTMDPNNPRVLYAAMWEHRRKPWHGYQLSSGGPGSGLHKSTDGGDTWTRLSNGFPTPAGKFATAVSAANSDRVYALVEAKPGQSGVYRSDNGGVSWQQVNNLHVMTERSAYYMHIYADPKDAETVYVLNAPMFKSTDGGKSYTRMQTPHGDNHDLWIHPENSDWMVQANDGGANVSFNGGASWSTQANQPTAQFYRVITDNLFPYNLYAGQQDNSSVKIASRTFGPGIGTKDWNAVGGGESAHVAFDPDNPTRVYAGSYQGTISEHDVATGRNRNVMKYPMRTTFRPADGYPYRFNWNAPIVMSRFDGDVLYHAANVLMKSTDRGQNWTPISPDLTRNEPAKQGIVEGEFTFEGTAGEMYNTIFYVAESQHEEGTIWTGSDDGLIHLTRDGGANWDNVTPRGMPETQINMIEASPHDPAKAYAVATRYKFNDFTPAMYRTEDYGKNWRRINDGIPDGHFVRVVREDPKRAGLLYAGTEVGAYVSFDDGRNWQSLQTNLPVVPITDMRVQGNDLVAATQGRAFWILDDISPLREIDRNMAAADWHLFKPAATERVQVSRFGLIGGQGQNPPTGTQISYTFDAAPDPVTVQLDILDGSGATVATYTTKQRAAREERLVAWAQSDGPGKSLTSNVGMNRFVWDWNAHEIGDYPELSTYRGPRTYRVAPGRYTARLTVGEETAEQPFDVLPDPRSTATAAGYAAQQELLKRVSRDAEDIQQAVEEGKATRVRITSTASLFADTAAVTEAAQAALDKLIAWEDAVIQSSNPNFIDALHSPDRLDFNMLNLFAMVDRMDPPITGGMADRVRDVQAEWKTRKAELDAIMSGEVAAFDAATKR